MREYIRRIQLPLTPKLHEALRREARRLGIAVTELIRRAICKALGFTE